MTESGRKPIEPAKLFGHQLQKSSDTRWEERGEHTKKYVANHRRMLIKVLEKAEEQFADALKLDLEDPEMSDIQGNLKVQYTKLWKMDHFGEIEIDARYDKDGRSTRLLVSEAVENLR